MMSANPVYISDVTARPLFPRKETVKLTLLETSPAAPAAPESLPLTAEDYCLPEAVKESKEPVKAASCDALYAEFQPLVWRLIRQYGDSADLREDLVGEIYMRFRVLLDAYDPQRGVPLKPYLVRQLSASVYSFARNGWRRNRREISLDIANETTGAAATIADPSAQWDDTLMLQKVQSGLPSALAQLSYRQRQAVIWRYYESRSFEEIAQWLSIRPATARSILRHALNNLRRKLQEADLNYD